jgi:hypothetical protein
MSGMIAAWGDHFRREPYPEYQGPRANVAKPAAPRAGTFARAG